MKLHSLALSCAVALVACTSSDPTTPVTPPTTDGGAEADAAPIDGGATGPEYQSGTRLRAQLWVSADGAKIIHGFYDTQLKTACAVTTAEDGSFRCLPTRAHGSLYYSDAACTKAVTAVFDDCAAPYVGGLAGTCGLAFHASTATTSTATTLYDDASGSCAVVSVTPKALFEAGPKLAPAGFVKATRTREPRGTALMMEFWDMEDGARMPIGAYDTVRKGVCASSAGLGELTGGHCVPMRVGYAEGQFADPSCTVAAALVIENACGYAADDVLGSAWVYGKKPNCLDDSVVGFASISTTLQSQAYSKSGNTCTTIPSPGKYAAVTGNFALGDLPQMKPGPDGSGRIVRHVERAPTGEKLLAERFFDTTLNARCDAMTAADGKLRCVPTGDFAFWYLDAACKQPVFAATVAAGCAYDVPEWMEANVNDGKACPGSSTTSYKVGAKIASSDTLYTVNGATCQANTGLSSWTLYGTTEQPATTFAELTDVTE